MLLLVMSEKERVRNLRGWELIKRKGIALGQMCKYRKPHTKLRAYSHFPIAQKGKESKEEPWKGDSQWHL